MSQHRLKSGIPNSMSRHRMGNVATLGEVNIIENNNVSTLAEECHDINFLSHDNKAKMKH